VEKTPTAVSWQRDDVSAAAAAAEDSTRTTDYALVISVWIMLTTHGMSRPFLAGPVRVSGLA